jgi:hypothetical protein
VLHELSLKIFTSKHAPSVHSDGRGDDFIRVGSLARHGRNKDVTKTTRTHGPLYLSSIRPSQQDSLLYTQFSRTHPSSISLSIHSIHYETHLSLYLNISMCDLVLKDLLRQI